jgi:hypothetical protein
LLRPMSPSLAEAGSIGSETGLPASLFALLHVVAASLLVVVALAWGRYERRRLVVASVSLSALAVIVTYAIAVKPSDIPVDWITVLHEGLGRLTIMQLYGQGVHAGANFAFVQAIAAHGAFPALQSTVWLNLLLALVDAIVFLHVAAHVVGRVWGVVWTLVFALNPATFLASFSELPTNLLALYFLCAVLGWALALDPRPQPRLLRAAGYALCATLTLLAGFTRVEVSLLGAVALATQAARAMVGAEAWSTAGRRARAVGERALAFLGDHLGVVAGLCVLGIPLAINGLPWGLLGRSESAMLYPFNPSVFSLYFYLPLLLLPIGVTIAVLAGSLLSVVEFRRFGGLALSLLLIVRAYFPGQNEYFEMGRYLSYVLPAVFVLGVFGHRELGERLRQRLPLNWSRAGRIVYVMAWFTLPLPGVTEFYLRPHYDRGIGVSQLLLDLNNQREARHLVKLTEENPECVFVARVVEDRHGSARSERTDPKVATHYDYMAFGAPLAGPILEPEGAVTLDDFVAKTAAGASCVRLYFGGDCNLTFSDGCTQFIAGRRRIDEHRSWSRPFSSMLEYGYAAPELVLATYAWR